MVGIDALRTTMGARFRNSLHRFSLHAATSAITTLTVKMAPNDAILILICAYVGTIYGGSRTAILLNIPGTAANVSVLLIVVGLPYRP